MVVALGPPPQARSAFHGEIGRTGPRFMAEPDRFDAVMAGPGLDAAKALRHGRVRIEVAGEGAA